MQFRRYSPWTPLLSFFAAGAVLAVAARAHANEIQVPLDNAQMLTFRNPCGPSQSAIPRSRISP